MAVKNLLRIVKLKLQATELGIAAVRSDPKLVRVAGAVPAQAFYKCQAKDRGLLRWAWTANELTLPKEQLLPDEQLSAVERLLKSLGDCILAQTVS